MRVLLVEDEIDSEIAIQRGLKQEKYIVDWVQNGKEAWDYLDHLSTKYNMAILN